MAIMFGNGEFTVTRAAAPQNLGKVESDAGNWIVKVTDKSGGTFNATASHVSGLSNGELTPQQVVAGSGQPMVSASYQTSESIVGNMTSTQESQLTRLTQRIVDGQYNTNAAGDLNVAQIREEISRILGVDADRAYGVWVDFLRPEYEMSIGKPEAEQSKVVSGPGDGTGDGLGDGLDPSQLAHGEFDPATNSWWDKFKNAWSKVNPLGLLGDDGTGDRTILDPVAREVTASPDALFRRAIQQGFGAVPGFGGTGRRALDFLQGEFQRLDPVTGFDQRRTVGGGAGVPLDIRGQEFIRGRLAGQQPTGPDLRGMLTDMLSTGAGNAGQVLFEQAFPSAREAAAAQFLPFIQSFNPRLRAGAEQSILDRILSEEARNPQRFIDPFTAFASFANGEIPGR